MPYVQSNPYDIVKEFERQIAEYAGSKFAVAVSSCTNAIFLCLKFVNVDDIAVAIPHKTYPGVACSIVNAGGRCKFIRKKWYGDYTLGHTGIVDSALRFKRNMYKGEDFRCLSFHVKKHIPIGRGGMILTNDPIAYLWLKQARFDGRQEKSLREDDLDVTGWNMYLTPEQAARGLTLFNLIKDKKLKDLDDYATYPDLSKSEVYK